MCECPTNLDLTDDSKDGEWCCPEAEAEWAGRFEHCEPANDPQPQVLLPEIDQLPIELRKVDPRNAAALFKGFLICIGQLQQGAGNRLSEADVLAAILRIIRGYAQQTVVIRAQHSADAAVANKMLIIHKLEKIIDELLHVDVSPTRVF